VTDCTANAAQVRERLVAVLRALHLLRAYDSLKRHWATRRARPDNAAFARAHPDFPVPPLDLCYDAYGHVSYREYAESGRTHAAWISGRIAQHAPAATAVLEWGCGPARVLRHIGDHLANHPALAGSDYNAASIAWCRGALRNIRFEANALAPPLAFPDAAFDVVYALSVLTHLSQPMHEAWRRELRRVLKPEGILIVTTHGDAYRDRHLAGDERARYEAGELVVRGGLSEGTKWYAAFHPPAWMRARFFAGWTVLEHTVEPLPGSLDQELWVARPDDREC
jgi:SAM-dependent methyltransferase